MRGRKERDERVVPNKKENSASVTQHVEHFRTRCEDGEDLQLLVYRT